MKLPKTSPENEKAVDLNSQDSFPASDPPSFTPTVGPGSGDGQPANRQGKLRRGRETTRQVTDVRPA